MQTISTKYLPATNTLGSRIKATTSEGVSITTHYSYDLTDEEMHCILARKLAQKMGWTGTMQGGGTKTGMVFCFMNSATRFKI